jgi:TolB-like protein/DNA-binding winged helix-turn-helix (wHTH) protein/thioredoxin-like negative regulator of GroEL
MASLEEPIPPEVELDLARYELRRGGRVERLEKLPMELLTLLAERRGKLVTRAEILERLWGKEVFIDADAAINTAVRKVRRALGDDSERPRFLETVVGKGYRFVGPITVIPGAEATPSTADGAVASQRLPGQTGAAISRWSVSRRWALGAVALAALIVALLAGLGRFGSGGGRAMESVAVLPFENTGGDSDAEYLSDGISESLINHLSRLPHLKVIARASVFRYKGKHPDLASVARELGVRAVVTGRVSQRGDGLFVAVELTDARENKQLWGATYNRRSSDLVAAQEELTAEVAEKLRLELTPSERTLLAKRDTTDPEAYRLYLRGRYLSNERTEAALWKAIEYFQEAIARDPRYALAYSGLADVHCTMATSYNKRAAPREAYPLARAAALRAVEIDAELSEAHASLGQILVQFDWDWAGAEREFRRALELNPSNGVALHWRSHCYLAQGRFEESARDAVRALDTDPVSVMLNIHLGEHYHLARQYDLAIEQYRKALELNPNHPNARPLLALAYEAKGMYTQAIAELEKSEPFWAGTSRVRGPLGRVYGLAGRRAEALKVLQELVHERAGPKYIAADDIAAVYIGLGETAPAFAWLQRACDERATALVNLKVEPAFDGLRGDRRFADLLRCVGLS